MIRTKYGHAPTLSGRPSPPLPLLPVVLTGPLGRLIMPGLVDTGSTVTAIPFGAARVLGLRRGKERDVYGIGGSVVTSETKVDLQVEHMGFIILQIKKCRVQILPAKCDIWCVILGRDTIFKPFKVTFSEKDQEIILEPFTRKKGS